MSAAFTERGHLPRQRALAGQNSTSFSDTGKVQWDSESFDNFHVGEDGANSGGSGGGDHERVRRAFLSAREGEEPEIDDGDLRQEEAKPAHELHQAIGLCGNLSEVQQMHAMRPIQASYQMAFDVFGWLVAAIETLEKMENEELMQECGIDISEQSKPFYQNMMTTKKTKEDILEQCNSYLGIMAVQMMSCHDDIKVELRRMLKESAQNWCETGLSEEESVLLGRTGNAPYFRKELLSVLDGSQPKMLRVSVEDEAEAAEPSSGEVRCSVFSALQQGMEVTAKLHEEFERNMERQAVMPMLRKPTLT